LKGVVLLAGVVIVLSATVVFRHMLWRGANAFLAMAICMLGVGAASIHYLARPHIFTLVLWAASLWVLDRDRRQPTPAVWSLVPLAALWTNLHGGFVALLASLALLSAASAAEALADRWWPGAPAASPGAGGRPRWWRSRRYLALLAGCSLASLVNPYGVRLHLHIGQYLRSDWIRNTVDEFQSPRFRSENILHFEILLFAGLMLAGSLLRRRQIEEALLILFWAHAALVSARHVPLFVILSSPAIAEEASRIWRQWAQGKSRKSPILILDQVAEDLRPGFGRTSLVAPLVILVLAATDLPLGWPRDFPHQKFPVPLVERHQARLAGARVFTSDQWADYLIYRFYPRHKVFFDGRSDFYGPSIGKQYLRAVQAHPEWESILDRHRFDFALLSPEWPLANILPQHRGWRVLERDALAILFERRR